MDGGESSGHAARPRSGARRQRCRGFECDAGSDRFDGNLATGDQDELASLDADKPLVALSAQLLGDELGFLEPMERAYGTALADYRRRLLLIQGIEASSPFLMDPECRTAALDALCRRILRAPGMLIVYPPTTLWRPASEEAQFRMHHVADQNLMLCALMGELGFAQLCDDMLGYPIPLLTVPWHPERGLLKPCSLPSKTFSRTLRVERVARRRLVLFDVRCGPDGA